MARTLQTARKSTDALKRAAYNSASKARSGGGASGTARLPPQIDLKYLFTDEELKMISKKKRQDKARNEQKGSTS
ncbi:hypothetical protein FRB99_006466 [Tulasnella sp. 403]|nr:hypothetical protein FRB99_006466 [Tulasnella sp. 403]